MVPAGGSQVHATPPWGGVWHWLNTACWAGAIAWHICAEAPINKKASRRGERQKAAQRGVSRLAAGYDGDEPERMTVEGSTARGRPARGGLRR